MKSTYQPPFSYYGGKQRLASEIIKLIPQHRVYVEPFAGGAAVFAKKTPTEPGYVEVLNDTDKRLVNFYRVLQHPIKAYRLYTRLLFTPYSREVHRDAKALNKALALDEIDAAVSYYIDVMCSHSHVLGRGWKRSISANGKSSAVVDRRVQALEKIVERMRGVYIECMDAIDLIRLWDCPDTFFYLDPPYPGADQGHYSGYSQSDFQRLVSALKEVKGSFLLSNYEQPEIPAEWERFGFPAPGSRNEKTEIVWRKISSLEPSPIAERLYRVIEKGKKNA